MFYVASILSLYRLCESNYSLRYCRMPKQSAMEFQLKCYLQSIEVLQMLKYCRNNPTKFEQMLKKTALRPELPRETLNYEKLSISKPRISDCQRRQNVLPRIFFLYKVVITFCKLIIFPQTL